jgi:squalene synthase HpnC
MTQSVARNPEIPKSRNFRFPDLQRYGPETAAKPPTARQSRRYCRRLARRHYENFTVVSWLLPRPARQHVANIYAYCRWADDLADEVQDPQRSLALLDWWEAQLRDCYAGRASHPVFVALAETIREFQVPADPFLDLLVAFRQDQRQTRYETTDDVLGYCRCSANPVGRLVLYLARCHTPDRTVLSDMICSGLQLANFCQDVARDWDRDRVYLPRAAWRWFGYEETDFAQRRCNERFREFLAHQVAHAKALLDSGSALVGKMPRPWRLPVALFAAGGLATLEAIRRQRYDVWTRRPTVGRGKKLRLALDCWWKARNSSG